MRSLPQNAAGRRIGAICAGPMVLGHLGLLDGRRATCYPGFEKELAGATYTRRTVHRRWQHRYGQGPGATFAYAYAILEMFKGERVTRMMKEGMMYE